MEKLIYTGERYVPGQTAVSVQKTMNEDIGT